MKHDIYAPGDASLAPGEARCPGPSVQEMYAATGEAVPQPLLEQKADFLGDEDLSFERYCSQEVYDAEVERVWARTWQWACREEHIPQPGDYTVYDVDRFSVLVVRGTDLTIRAFVNSCPHRGMQLFDAGESGRGKQFLRCPFHGISFELDGSVRDIPCRWDFPHVQDEAFGLDEVPCDTWGGFVFINLDKGAQPLLDYLEVLPEHFADWKLEDRYVSLHTQKILPGNWKMCMEGFMEAYHVMATHPEGLRMSSWANTQYDLLSPHVSRFVQALQSTNPQYEKQYSDEEVYALLGYDPDTFRAGVPVRQQHADNLRQSLGEQLGRDLSDVPNAIVLDSIEYHVFPNACFFPGIAIPLIYRFRPLGVDRCIHDIMLLLPIPDNGERPPPAQTVHLDIDEPYVSVEDFKGNRLAAVLDQDTDNFKRQWAGINASLKGKQTLANYQESRIRHFHRALDAYLGSS